MVDELHLRPVREEDEAACLDAHNLMRHENFPFLLGYEPPQSWSDYVRKLDERTRGRNLASGWVPSTFLLAVVRNDIAGRASIRHSLNEYLATAGGHIGYCVLPAFRGRGFATEILRQSLDVARLEGVDRALVTCDVANLASARVIEKCGGVFESEVADSREDVIKRRYWISC
jgi:predicted acetyltransferase